MSNLIKYLNQFKNKNIVVIGDLILDKYILGKIERISPEAPVPVVEVELEKYAPGGAANAANNVTTLGGNSYLFGILGNDNAKDILLEVAKDKGINTKGIIIDSKKTTTQKIRIIGQKQQLLRIDYETREYLDGKTNEEIISRLNSFQDIDMILISDYAKGVITKELIEKLKQVAQKNKIKIIADPKPKHKSIYKGVYLLTPNKKEAEEMTGIIIETESDIEKAGKMLMTEMHCNVLITMGEKGMSLFEENKKPVHIPTVAKEVYDVSGAGDTVIATLSLAIASGATLYEAAILANYAGGIKVGKLGTAPVMISELIDNINNLKQ